MKKIVPFSKDLMFKTSILEITSIALDNTLKLDENIVTGEFIISGTYRMIGSLEETDFKFNIPVDITIDSKYDTSKCLVSIDDFSYEIINEEKLKVNISVMLDDLDIKEDEEISKIEVIDTVDSLDNRNEKEFTMLDEELNNVLEINNQINNQINNKMNNQVNNSKPDEVKENTKLDNNLNIFNATMTDTHEYSIYRVYTMKEDDTLELIYEKYNVNKEILSLYNDLDNLSVGSKIIIPSVDE